MKLLCVADATDSLIFSKVAPDLYKDVDFVISAGDLPLRYYDYIQTVLRKDVYFVYGNHNLEDFDHYMRGLHMKDEGTIYLHNPKAMKTVQCGGFFLDGKCMYIEEHDLLIAGLGGSMLYNGGKSQYSERQMQMRISKLAPRLVYNKKKYGRALDILVTHAPPYQLGDGPDLCHRGFDCFKAFMDRFEPRYLLHGHVHLDDLNAPREREYGKTRVINVYKNYILED